MRVPPSLMELPAALAMTSHDMAHALAD